MAIYYAMAWGAMWIIARAYGAAEHAEMVRLCGLLSPFYPGDDGDTREEIKALIEELRRSAQLWERVADISIGGWASVSILGLLNALSAWGQA